MWKKDGAMKSGLSIKQNIVENYYSSMQVKNVLGTITKLRMKYFMIVRYGESEKIEDAEEMMLMPGMNFYIYPGLIHQMEAIEDSELFEFSTEHFDEDSYRIIKGD